MKINRIISILLTCVMGSSLFVNVFAASDMITLQSSGIADYKKDTPEENLFRVEGNNNREFVLLDSDKDGVLVLANEIYTAMPFDEDATQRFDPYDSNNIAYYLNNTMLEDKSMLPEELIPYIDTEREWKTEAGHPDGNCPQSYSVICGVSLLSYTELIKYAERFGVRYNANRKDWYTRSPLGSKAADTGIVCGGTYSLWGKVDSTSTSNSLGIRPVFWLKREFFTEVRVSIPHLGEDVAQMIRKSFKDSELSAGAARYTDYDLKRIGYEKNNIADEYIKIDIPNAPIYIQDHKSAYAAAEITIGGDKSVEYTAEYSADGAFDDTVSITGTAHPNKKLILRFDLSKIKKDKYPEFTIRVRNENGLLAEEIEPVTLMDFVNPEPLSEYSRYGMNYHIDQNTSSYINKTRDVELYNKIMSYMGSRKLRSIHRWEYTETTKGERPNGRHNDVENFMVKYDQHFAPYILGFRNPKYYPADPKSYEDVMATIEYCKDITDHLMKNGVVIDDFEIWNEPNLLSFWRSDNWITYSQFANRLAFEMNKLYPDIPIMGAAISSTGTGGVQGDEYLDAYFRRGALMYVGAFSCHPYTYPNNPDMHQSARGHVMRASKFVDMRYDAGGWLDVSQTEVGFPTHKGTGGTIVEDQAIYLPKLYIYNDEMDIYLTNIYTFETIGEDDTYREHEFGVIDVNLIPKPAVVSLAQIQKYGANAVYLGRFPISEGSYAYVYNKLGKLYAIVWSAVTGEVIDYKLESGVTAEDMNGNPIEPQNGTIEVGEKMVYLNNIPFEYLIKSTGCQARNELEGIAEEFGEEIDRYRLMQLIEPFRYDYKCTENQLLKGIDGIFEYGNELIAEVRANPDIMDKKRLSLLLFKLHRIAKRAAYAYSYYDLKVDSGEVEYNNTLKKIDQKKGDEPDSSLLYTDAIMRFAYNYNKKSADIIQKYQNVSGAKGIASACNILKKGLSGWAYEFSDLEERDTSRAVFTYLEDAIPTLYKQQKFSYYVDIENLRQNDINGSVVWRDANSNAMGEETPCTIEAGECKRVKFEGVVPERCEFGKQIFYVDIMENGKILKRSEMDVTVEAKIDAELEDAHTTLENMKDLSVNIISSYNEPVMGTVEITAPEGWVLEKYSKRFVVKPGETEAVEFNILKSEKVAYNEYPFSFTVTDNNGNVLSHQDKLLDFTIAVKSSSDFDFDGFNGDISEWENAYPIHVNPPDNASALESWTNANIAMKQMMKWDNNYMYILTDVYDDMYTQSYSGQSIWQGDSIQIAFDTLNDKTEKYDANDYEYGISYSSVGTEVYAFSAAQGKSTGSKPSAWAKIIRDNDHHITRYLVRIPSAELSPLSFSEGTEFGFNVCANDADVLERESSIEFTPGVNGTKNPSKFKTFRLVGSSQPARADEGKDIGFVKKINDDGFETIGF